MTGSEQQDIIDELRRRVADQARELERLTILIAGGRVRIEAAQSIDLADRRNALARMAMRCEPDMLAAIEGVLALGVRG